MKISDKVKTSLFLGIFLLGQLSLSCGQKDDSFSGDDKSKKSLKVKKDRNAKDGDQEEATEITGTAGGISSQAATPLPPPKPLVPLMPGGITYTLNFNSSQDVDTQPGGQPLTIGIPLGRSNSLLIKARPTAPDSGAPRKLGLYVVFANHPNLPPASQTQVLTLPMDNIADTGSFEIITRDITTCESQRPDAQAPLCSQFTPNVRMPECEYSPLKVDWQHFQTVECPKKKKKGFFDKIVDGFKKIVSIAGPLASFVVPGIGGIAIGALSGALSQPQCP